MSYVINYYQNNAQTGSTTCPTVEEALDLLVASTERYAQTEGFYVKNTGTNSFSVVDLSPKAIEIVLVGQITAEMKATLANRFDALLNKWLSKEASNA
jgi:hypothetical protein